MSKVAFVGCGRMGVHMARFTLDGGNDLVVFDPNPAATAGLVEKGARLAPSAGIAADGADFVVTSLPDPPAVEGTYFGEGGIIANAKADAILIDTSTSSPALARKIQGAARAVSADSLDAPVSGGPMGAEAGTLAVMVGGATESFERALPLLELFGKKIMLMGEAGSGQATKLTNNLLAGCYMASISEAVALATREGLDPEKLFEVWSNGTGNSRVLHTRFPVPGALPQTPASNDWKPLFPVDLVVKDLDLALEMADRLGVELPMTDTARGRYRLVQERGEGGLDYSIVSQLIAVREEAA